MVIILTSFNLSPTAYLLSAEKPFFFVQVFEFIKNISIVYYPSMYQFTSAASSPPLRITKGAVVKPVDIAAPKSAPLYLQIDAPEENILRISLSALHPRILLNSGVPIVDYIEQAYLILEKFEWFVDCDIPMAKAYVKTRGYDSVEVAFKPGRHICRSDHLTLISKRTAKKNSVLMNLFIAGSGCIQE